MFTAILKSNAFPLAPILRELLELGRRSIGHEVEIEFAVTLSSDNDKPHEFSILQCRPMLVSDEDVTLSPENATLKRLLCYTKTSMGHGVIQNLWDVVYVPPERWEQHSGRKSRSSKTCSLTRGST